MREDMMNRKKMKSNKGGTDIQFEIVMPALKEQDEEGQSYQDIEPTEE